MAEDPTLVDDWDDASEDEATVTRNMHHPNPSPASSSWSFYPFSLVSPSATPGPSAAASSRNTHSSPLPSPFAASAATRAKAAPSLSLRAGSSGSGVPRAKATENGTREQHTTSTRTRGEPPSPVALVPELSKEEKEQLAKKDKETRLERCRESVKSNVKEIVADPVALLSLFSITPPLPPTPSTPIHSGPPHSAPAALSSRPPSQTAHPEQDPDSHELADDEDEDDPAAGYISLNALNLSSGGPQIVEFGKEEELEEDKGERGREKRRREKFLNCLMDEDVDLAALRKLAWAGIPPELRPIAWQLLLGYLPAPSSRRLPTLSRKRQEYADAVRLAFSRGVKGLDGPIWHQISIDVPRTNPGIRLWGCEAAQRALERILYVWAIRHPASGYVQGINDLVTPFFQVFLSAYIETDPEDYDVAALSPFVLEALEADSFWCLSKLLDGIQDNYIFAQPGIQRQVAKMKELCSRVDAPLAKHLVEHNVEFIQFAFRWMNCLLMRELSVKNIVRMWDTYLAEGDHAFSEFHLYVCLAFLVKWSDQLRGMDFQSIIMFLQSLPTQDWSDKNTELLLSEAFMWSRTFDAKKW